MKCLILEYNDSIKSNSIRFRIKDQSHRCSEFGRSNHRFDCKIGITLTSCGIPDWTETAAGLFFVRGHDHCCDNVYMECSSEYYWAIIKNAVREYNNYFGNYGQCIIDENMDPEPIIPVELFTL